MRRDRVVTRWARALVLGGALAAAWACARAAEPPRHAGGPDAGATVDARRAEVRFPDGGVVVAEIADTPRRVQEGYMFRREVGEGEGMIFVFPEADVHPFWMKNTLVPLDIIWLDDGFTVVHLESAVPCTADPCPSYGPLRKARYVLEVRGGTAARRGLKPGDHLLVSFPQAAR